MKKKDCALLIFIKYPHPGWVKTRLAHTLGLERAAQCYADMAERSVERYESLAETDCTLYFDPAEELDLFQTWLGNQHTYLAQPKGDLGQRLAYGFETLLKSYSSVIALGTDSPDLPLHYIAQAQECLQQCDLVLGPTMDGGYYLIGMCGAWLSLFDEIPWSSEKVLHATMKQAANLELSTLLLPEWYDIDTSDDLQKLQKSRESQIQELAQKYCGEYDANESI